LNWASSSSHLAPAGGFALKKIKPKALKKLTKRLKKRKNKQKPLEDIVLINELKKIIAAAIAEPLSPDDERRKIAEFAFMKFKSRKMKKKADRLLWNYFEARPKRAPL
jgi:hypothetical protein